MEQLNNHTVYTQLRVALTILCGGRMQGERREVNMDKDLTVMSRFVTSFEKRLC